MSIRTKRKIKEHEEKESRYTECPICGKQVPIAIINLHIDSGCESHGLMKQNKRQKMVDSEDSSPPIQSTPSSPISDVVEIDSSPKFSPASKLIKKEKSSISSPSHTKIVDVNENHKPLSEIARPCSFEELYGHEDLFGENGSIINLIKQDRIPSLILWGPPGCGKTTIAKIISKVTKKRFITFSAVDSGTKDIMEIAESSKNEYKLCKRETILFIDEIHRYNKKQQDIFLPYIENGTFILIGATTENPSFSLNNALLSRCRIEKLESLNDESIKKIINRVLKKYMNGMDISDEGMKVLVELSNGDARSSINILDQLEIKSLKDNKIEKEDILKILSKNKLFYDKKGDNHYDTISAFHKSLRGSDPDAATYYLARMLEGGEDPLYVARRMIRFASEDVGLADPMALEQAILSYQTCQFIGLPECKLALLQCALYLALSPKSNELDVTYNKVADLVNSNPQYSIPYHIRNGVTNYMKKIGYGEGYKYSPDFDYMEEQTYLPTELVGKQLVDITRLRGFGRFKPDDIPQQPEQQEQQQNEESDNK